MPTVSRIRLAEARYILAGISAGFTFVATEDTLRSLPLASYLRG